jgi:hypothetical protein
MNSTVLAILLLVSPLTLAQTHHHHEGRYAHLPIDGRRALHGMVLFGSGPYFLEHIPMLTPPHDFQILTEVVLKDKNGTKLKFNFSNEGFTLKPTSHFSLNDYIAGKLQKFNGSIFKGNFETNGQLMRGFENITVEVKSNRFVSQLPRGPSRVQDLIFSDGKNTFKLNFIRNDSNFQSISNIEARKVLWCVKGPDFIDPC